MNILKHLLNFYINSSIHVALAVVSLTWITLIEYDISFDQNVLFFVFYASIIGYNFVKYFGIAKSYYRRVTNWFKTILVFSFLCFFLMCYYVYQLQTNTLLCVLGFGIITLFYAVPFLPKDMFLDSKNNLRSIGGLKIYVIAIVWSGVTVILPLINNNYTVGVDVLITGLQRFVLIIVLMLPFEIRDLQFDSLKLATIPQKIGLKQTKVLGVLLIIVFFFLEFFKDEIDIKKIIVLLIISVTTLLFLLFSKIQQGKYYSSFLVEALPIFWLILLLWLN